MNDLIERIESDAPTFHTQGGQPVSFSVSFTVLRRLRQCLKAEMNTLETGCGTTTVVFAASGCHHCCVTLRAEETQKSRHIAKKRESQRTICNLSLAVLNMCCPECSMTDLCNSFLSTAITGFPARYWILITRSTVSKLVAFWLLMTSAFRRFVCSTISCLSKRSGRELIS